MSKYSFSLLAVFLGTLGMAHAKDAWLEVTSPHFTVISNGSEKQARHVADQFERMRSVFHEEFPQMNLDPGTPILVLAASDQKTFRALEPEAYLRKGQLDLAGLFLRAPDKNYVILRLDASGEHPYATVYHEYTHLLLSKIERLPLWLNEGWAEFYQTTEITNNDARIGLPSQENIVLLKQNRLLPLTTLFAVDQNSPYYHEENKGSIFYAESWVLTHFLMVNGGQAKLQNYAHLVSQNVDAVTAGSRAFGDLNQLQTALDKYISSYAFRYANAPMSTKADESTFKVQSLIPAEANAFRADFLAYNERVTDARALLTQVLHDDPKNALAHETMGYLEFRQGHLNEARKWYGEAVNLDSQSFLAHYYFAAMSMQSGPLEASSDGEVEKSLHTAIKLNPAFAPSYDQLAVFYGMRRKNLEEAHTLELNAVELDPGNVHYRLNTANILLQMQRSKDAITVLQNTLRLAKSPADVNEVQNTLNQAERYQAMVDARNEADDKLTDVDAESSGSTPEPAEDSNEGSPSSANGLLKNVECSYPAVMQVKLESEGHTLILHSSNYFKIHFTALNYAPDGVLNPCADLEGAKARVEFLELPTKPLEGQIVSIELSK